MGKKKAKSIRRRGKRQAGSWRIRLGAAFALVLLILGAVASLYVWRLDKAVVERFQNRRFSVASAVFSAPTELRAGQALARDEAVELLRVLDYVPAGGPEVRTGEYRLGKQELRFVTHPFAFPGRGREGAQAVRLRLKAGRLAAIEDLKTGRRLHEFTLEPLLLGKFYGAERETRQLVAYADIKSRFVPALIAAEDNRFYRHHGIDFIGLARAALVNLWHGGIRQGGSTLTQQLVKNLWLTPERTFRRKLSEVLMAVLLERHYTKEEILETYANIVYFGQRGSVSLLGVGEAAKYYFGKRPQDLTWGEASLLTGMIRSPALYNPFEHALRAQNRRNAVLNALAASGVLSAAAQRKAKAERVQSVLPPQTARRASYFVDYVARSLADVHAADELERDGLQVHTTLSAPLQLAAESAVTNGLRYLESQDGRLAGARLQAALVALDPATGRVLAYVGGRDYTDSQFDRAGQARRQLGSLVKPFVFYAAVMKGYGPTTTWSNDPMVLRTPAGDWSPENYTKVAGGNVSMRAALEQSLNLPTVRMALDAGLPAVKQAIEDAGIDGPVPAFPALALGAVEASPLEAARAYATLAAGGARPDVMPLAMVTDRENHVLQRFPMQTLQVLQAPAVYIVDQMLVGVIRHGTGSEAQRVTYAGDLAGKTGTTSDYHDAWFVGLTPSIVTVVWVGGDANQELHYPGAKLALPIWGEFMLTAVNWIAAQKFPQPEGVVWRDIDPESGEPAGERCSQRRPEVFLLGKEPAGECRLHQTLVDRLLNLLR